MLRSFTKSVLTLLMVAGLTTISIAQDAADDMARPITKSGSMAFMFNLSGLGTFGLSSVSIGNPDGNPVAGFGMKYYLADNQAVRVLLALMMTDDGDDPANTTNTTTSTIGIGAQYEYHFGALYSTSPYIGAAINFATTSSTSKNDANTPTETSTTHTQLGIGAVAGFDWYFTKGMALGAQYGLGFVSNSMSSDPAPTEDYPSSTNIGIAGAGAVHLVVHL